MRRGVLSHRFAPRVPHVLPRLGWELFSQRRSKKRDLLTRSCSTSSNGRSHTDTNAYVPFVPHCGEALPQKAESFLDTVSTGSGSDLVGDQHAMFPDDH